MPALDYAASLAFGYLCGSIPFGILLTRLADAPDLRAIGSGNIGATNVLRTGRKGLAGATLLGDMLKGTIAVLVAGYLFDRNCAFLAAIGAFLGHVFPVWLKFRGGKGVATYVGVLFGLAWPTALLFCAVWLGIAAVTRYSSLAALIASAAAPICLWFVGDTESAEVFLLLSLLLWIMHRGNIARLCSGSEGKIGVGTGATGGS
ncbi:MAG: glycerol-3-phosphate 1-O-acyltransferase PlsY [Hyphomicrobiales bacterium]|nr:glycerol-3-phosphate 1-O-acyltransferase PlsY [Hyphomicrobiales bacterium]